MIPSTCPQCGEPVSVPEAAFDLDAQAQCPWCGEISPIRKLKRPPVVKIFDASGNPLPIAALAGHFVGVAAAPSGSESSYPSESKSDIQDIEHIDDFNEDPERLSLAAIDSQPATQFDDVEDDDMGPWSKGNDAKEALEHENDDVEHENDDVELEDDVESFKAEPMADIESIDNQPVAWNPDEVESFDENKLDLAQESENKVSDEKRFPDFSQQLDSVDANEVVLDHDEFKLEDPVETPSGRPTPMRVRPAPYRPKPKSSPWKSIVGMALSPFLALGLAYVVFAAIGKVPNWGFWPFLGSSSVSVNRTAGEPMQLKPRPTRPVQSKVPAFNGPSPLAQLDTPPANDESVTDEPATNNAQGMKPSIDLPPSSESSSVETPATDPPVSTDSTSLMPPQEDPEAVDAPAPDAEEPQSETKDPMPMEFDIAPKDDPSVSISIEPLPQTPSDTQPIEAETTKVDPPKADPAETNPLEEDSANADQPPVEPAKVDQPESDASPEPTSSVDDPPAGNDPAPKDTSTELVETPEIIDAAGIAQRMVKAIGNDSLEEEKRTVWTSKTYLQLCKVSSFEPQATPAIEALMDELRSSKMIDQLAEMGNRYYADSDDPYLFAVGQYNADDKSFTMRGGPTFQLADPDPALKSGEVLAFGSVSDRDQEKPVFSASAIQPFSP